MKLNTFGKPQLFATAILAVLLCASPSVGIEMTFDELMSIVDSKASDVPLPNSPLNILTFFPKYVARIEVQETGQKIEIQGTSKFVQEGKFLVDSTTPSQGRKIHTVIGFDPQENVFVKWSVIIGSEKKIRRLIGITSGGSRSISWILIDYTAGTYSMLQHTYLPNSITFLEYMYKNGQLVQRVTGTVVAQKP